jgi:hypothetical protein
MAITFTNAGALTTAPNTAILDNQQTASLFFWFRYEAAGSTLSSQIGQTQVLGRAWDADAKLAGGSATGQVGLVFHWVNASKTLIESWQQLAVGVAYPCLMVYTQGQQTLYLPGQTISMGTITGSLVSENVPFLIGSSPPGSPCVYTLSDVNIWNGYACTQADYNALVIGASPTTIGAGATARYRWTLAGTTGATPAAGNAGLAEAYGGVYNLSPANGNGSAVYAAPLSYQPSAQISSKTRVGTSGQTVFFYFQAASTGASVTPLAVNAAPTLYQNGVSVGQLTTPLVDGARPFVQYNLPAGAQINPGDIVTVSAPSMWCTTTAGAVGALNNATIANKSGMSAFGTESLRKTIRMGMNFPHLGTSYYCLYRLQRNQRYNLSNFINATSAPDGTPLSFPGTSSSAYLQDWVGGNNGLDATDYPGGPGLRAIGWNSPPSSNTTFSLTTDEPANTTITERTDLANPGDANGNGRVRVFDVEQSPGSTTSAFRIFLTCSQANGTPNFSNLQIFGPGDFSYKAGQPVTLDQTNPYALSSVTLDRFHTGLGVARYMDSTIDFGGWSNATEPWHLRNITDFSWGQGVYSTNQNITYTQARPYKPGAGSYIYGPAWTLPGGSPFPATLATAIDNQTTTLTISDAATAPVIIGLTLSIGSELMTVTGVNGTTVTVVRGAGNTTPAAHSAGPIQVQNRLAVTSLSQVTQWSQIFEVVTSQPHGLYTGVPCVPFSGTWPTLTFTDGTTAVPGGAVPIVTGPTTFLVNLYSTSTNPVTLNQTYSLSGAT